MSKTLRLINLIFEHRKNNTNSLIQHDIWNDIKKR
jgi:hypothetical protein